MSALEKSGVLEDEVDDALRDDVREAEERAGDHDEAEHDGRGLADLLAIGPLHALKLRPARLDEGGNAGEPALARRGRGRGGNVAGASVARARVVIVEVDRAHGAEIARRSASQRR